METLVDMKVFTLSAHLKTLSSFELMVDDTVDGKDNQEEKTGEGVDIRMYHFSLNFLQLRSDML